MDLVTRAQEMCQVFHEGQFRKGNGEPYWVHPFAVADILQRHEYTDPEMLCIAYLHDTVEDTTLHLKHIRDIFGSIVSHGIFILSRNKGTTLDGELLSDEQYKERILYAWPKVQLVKISDMIDNTRTLDALDQSGIEKKVRDAKEFYIPLARRLDTNMGAELEENVDRYMHEHGLIYLRGEPLQQGLFHSSS